MFVSLYNSVFSSSLVSFTLKPFSSKLSFSNFAYSNVIFTGKYKKEDEDEGFSVEKTEHPDQGTGQQIKKPRNEEGYIISGYITIPKTNVSLPILDTYSAEAIETGVAVLWPTNPKLNEPGNTVIVGHNYKDGRFFSNNKKLSTGDKIRIKDLTGRELTYTIYDKFEASPSDASFYARDTNGAVEITLSTCTDDAKLRTIIVARVEE